MKSEAHAAAAAYGYTLNIRPSHTLIIHTYGPQTTDIIDLVLFFSLYVAFFIT